MATNLQYIIQVSEISSNYLSLLFFEKMAMCKSTPIFRLHNYSTRLTPFQKKDCYSRIHGECESVNSSINT